MTAPAHHQRARRRLADRLRELRKNTGANGAEFAEQLGWGQPKVSRFETAKRLPTEADVRAWADAAGADPQQLLDLLDRARAEYGAFRDRFADAGGADRFQDEIEALEAASARIADFQPAFVIGLCQTAAYARDLLHGPSGPVSFGASEAEIGRMIAARVRRQAILYESGRDILLVMGEAALRTRLASPESMRGQLEHLAQLTELTTVKVGIVPFAAPMPVMPLSGFDIRDDVVTIETLGGEIELADPAEVAMYESYLAMLLDVALTGAAAAELCRRVASDTN